MKAGSVGVRRSLVSGILIINTFFYASSQGDYKIIAYRGSVRADTVNALVPFNPSTGSGSIIFATAFRWNKSGPTGGYWTDNEVNDDVFRPVFTNIKKYKLQVYNRNGYKVFESSDLYKGWDGYLETGELALQGVYVWKVSGIFNDGTSFSKAGDVTFIH